MWTERGDTGPPGALPAAGYIDADHPAAHALEVRAGSARRSAVGIRGGGGRLRLRAAGGCAGMVDEHRPRRALLGRRGEAVRRPRARARRDRRGAG